MLVVGDVLDVIDSNGCGRGREWVYRFKSSCLASRMNLARKYELLSARAFPELTEISLSRLVVVAGCKNTRQNKNPPPKTHQINVKKRFLISEKNDTD